MQPLTRLIVIVADPVQRMYSDYYFLDDSRRPVQPGKSSVCMYVPLPLLPYHHLAEEEDQ